MHKIVNEQGDVLVGEDYRPLVFAGPNSFRLACHSVRGHRRSLLTTEGIESHYGKVFVQFQEVGKQPVRWEIHEDGSVTEE